MRLQFLNVKVSSVFPSPFLPSISNPFQPRSYQDVLSDILGSLRNYDPGGNYGPRALLFVAFLRFL